MGIEEVVTAPRSPWQNAFVGRVIGSIRWDCLDHVIVLNDRHLHGILASYFPYYHHWRKHLSLRLNSPGSRIVTRLIPQHAVTGACQCVRHRPDRNGAAGLGTFALTFYRGRADQLQPVAGCPNTVHQPVPAKGRFHCSGLSIILEWE